MGWGGVAGSSELQRCTPSSHRYEAQTRGHGLHRLYKKKAREDRTENIHITYTQRGGRANAVNNNILHSCESVTDRTSWQPDKRRWRRRRRWGLWGSDGNLGGCCCGGVSQVSGVCRLGGPLHGHPFHRLPRPGQRLQLRSSAGPQTD